MSASHQVTLIRFENDEERLILDREITKAETKAIVELLDGKEPNYTYEKA